MSEHLGHFLVLPFLEDLSPSFLSFMVATLWFFAEAGSKYREWFTDVKVG